MSSPHILIIEDDPTLLKGLTDNFVKRGYLVRARATARKALQRRCPSARI